MLWKFRKKERRYNGFLLRLITPYENVIMNYSIPFSSKRHKSAFKSAQYWHFRVNMLYKAYLGPCFAWNHNTEAPGYSWCNTIKIPHCLKVHMPKVVTPFTRRNATIPWKLKGAIQSPFSHHSVDWMAGFSDHSVTIQCHSVAYWQVVVSIRIEYS